MKPWPIQQYSLTEVLQKEINEGAPSLYGLRPRIKVSNYVTVRVVPPPSTLDGIAALYGIPRRPGELDIQLNKRIILNMGRSPGEHLWTPHDGGSCPVNPNTIVQVIHHNEYFTQIGPAKFLSDEDWKKNIKAWR